MASTTQRLLALTLAMSVIFAAFAGGGAAAPSIDTETTDTANQSDLQDGDTITNFNGSDSNQSIVQLQAEQTTNDTRVRLMQNESSGPNVMLAENASGVFQAIDTTNGESYHNHSFNHSEFADLERGINDNTSLQIRATNNTTVDNPDSAYIATVYVENNDEWSVQYVSDADVDSSDIVDVSEENGTELPIVDMEIGGDDSSSIDTNERDVNDSTKVVVALGNGTVFDDFDRVASEASDNSKLSGAFGERAVVLAEDDDGNVMALPVFKNGVPDSFDDSRTYAVYESVGGTQSIVVYQGDNLDTNTLDLEVVGSTSTFAFAFTYLSAGFSSAIGSVAFGGSVLAMGGLPLAATRHEPRDRFRATSEDGSQEVEG